VWPIGSLNFRESNLFRRVYLRDISRLGEREKKLPGQIVSMADTVGFGEEQHTLIDHRNSRHYGK